MQTPRLHVFKLSLCLGSCTWVINPALKIPTFTLLATAHADHGSDSSFSYLCGSLGPQSAPITSRRACAVMNAGTASASLFLSFPMEFHRDTNKEISGLMPGTACRRVGGGSELKLLAGFQRCFFLGGREKFAIQVRKSQLRQNNEERAANRELQALGKERFGGVKRGQRSNLHCKDFALKFQAADRESGVAIAKKCAFCNFPWNGVQSQPLPLNKLGERVKKF